MLHARVAEKVPQECLRGAATKSAVPEGRADNSPAVYCWDREPNEHVVSPGGTTERASAI